LNVVAETPEWDQGDTDDKPIPAPTNIRKRDRAHAVAAPAAIDAHDTAETNDSPVVGRVATSIVNLPGS
jgi:hypothetical protein